MSNVENRIVQMILDNKQFENAAKATLATMDRIKNASDFSNIGKNIPKLDIADKLDLSGVQSAVEKVNNVFSTMGIVGVAALQKITSAAINAGASIVDKMLTPIKTGFAEYETQINATQTILANTSNKGSTINDVNAALSELNKYADLTIYNFTEMTKNIGTFTAAGIDLDTSVQAIKGIANLAAVSGSTSQQASTAMYQLSQALAAGSLKLQDWNSVVNAGMGGEVFQEALKETARVHGIAIDSMIAEEGSFRETLKEGWISSAVLTETLAKFTGDLSEEQLKSIGYTDKQIKGIMQMGKTANEAATKVKTISQLFDTLGEAVQSGWTESWQIVVGDFEEAKASLTVVSDTFGEMIGASAEARNSMLRDWKELGGRDSAINALVNIFKALLNIINPIKEAFREIFPPMTGQQLFEITKAVENLTAKFVISEKTAENLKRVFKGVFAAIDLLLKPIELVVSILAKLAAIVLPASNGALLSFVAVLADGVVKLRDFVDGSKLVEKTAGSVARVLGGVINVFLNLASAIGGAVSTAINGAISIFSKFGSAVATQVNQIFSYIYDMDWSWATDFATKVRDGFADAISYLSTIDFGWVVDWAVKIKSSFGESFSSIGEWSKKSFAEVGRNAESFGNTFAIGFEKVKDAVSGAADKIKEFALEAGDVLQNAFSNLGDGFSNAFEKLSAVGDKIVSFFSKLGATIREGINLVSPYLKNFASQIGFDDVIKAFAAGSFGALALSIKGLIDNLKELAGDEGAGGLLSGISDVLDGVKDSLTAWQNQIKAQVLKDIAIAVAILAGSIVALSLIDPTRLTDALSASLLMLGELMGSLALFNKIGGDISELQETAFALIEISVAINIMAGALKKLGNIDSDQLVHGLVGVFGAVSSFALAMRTMKDVNGLSLGSAVSIVALAQSVKMLVAPIQQLSQMAWGELTKGLAGVGAAMTEISLSLRGANFKDIGLTGSVAMISLAQAVKMLGESVAIFASFSVNALVTGLGATGVLLKEISVFSKQIGNAKDLLVASVGTIALATGLKSMSGAVMTFASMNLSELATGLTAVAIALTEVSLFSKYIKNPGQLLVASVAIIALGKALENISKAVGTFASFNWGELTKGLVGVGGSLGTISLAMSTMPEGLLTKALSIAVLAESIGMLIPILSTMGGFSIEEIAKSLITLAGSLTIIAAALNLAQGTLAGSAAIMVMAGSLALLTPALVTFANLNSEQIKNMLLSLAGALAAFTLAGIAISPVGPALIAVGAAITLFGAGIGLAVAGLALLINGFVGLGQLGSEGVTNLGLAFDTLISKIPSFLASVGEGVVQFAQVIANGREPIMNAISTILSAMIEVLIATIPAFVGGMMDLITETLSAINERLPDFLQQGIAILTTLSQGIGEASYLLAEVAVVAITSFIQGITNNMDPLVQAAFDMIVQFVDSLATAIDENTDRLVDSFLKMADALIQGLIKGITGGIGLVVNAAKDLGEALLDKIKSVLKIHSPSKETEAIGKNTAEGLANGVNSQSTSAISAMTNTVQKILTEITNKVSRFLDSGKQIMTGFINGMKNKQTEAQSTMRTIIDKVLAEITQKNTKFIEGGKKVIQSFIDGMKSKTTEAQNTIKTMLDNIVRSIDSKSSDFRSAGSKLVDAFTDGIESRSSSVSRAISDMVSRAVKDADVSSDFRKLGQQLVEGFIDGIESYAKKAAQAAAAMAKRAKDAADEELDSHSPSREFIKRGRYVAEGFAIGMSKYAGLAEDSAKDMADLSIDSVQRAIAKMDLAMNDIDAEPKITPVIDLSKAETSLRQLDSSIEKARTLKISGMENARRFASSSGLQKEPASVKMEAKQEPVIQNYNFHQNNYSPKALSRLEIYRQTRNQFAMMEEATSI